MIGISRDKIALVVFAALLILGMAALIGYIQLGHSWNVAASNIDDVTGTMDDYTTILYEGTVPLGAKVIEEDEDDQEPLDASSSREASSFRNPFDRNDDLDIAPKQGIPSKNDERSAEEKAAAAEARARLQEFINTKGTVNRLSEAALSSDLIPEDPLFGLDLTETETTIVGPGANTASAKKVTILDREDVEKSYREKGATVITLDTENPEKYQEGLIIKKGSKRVGVFSVSETDTTFKIEQRALAFNKYSVDFVVAITPSKKLVEKAQGIDIVISTQNEKLFVMGETINNTFYVGAPTKGSIGAILISPSNVVSAKVLTEI